MSTLMDTDTWTEKVNYGNMKQNLADGFAEAFINDQCKGNAKEFWIKACEQGT